MRMRLTVNRFAGLLAARGESLAAFDGRCIPAGCVAPRSNTPGILGRRALPAGRLARLGATPDFHHGLLSAAHAWSLGVPWGRRLLRRFSLERTVNCGPGGQESYHGPPAVPA